MNKPADYCYQDRKPILALSASFMISYIDNSYDE